MKPQAILFDIGSTLWSSPAEDPAALAYCYGRGHQIIFDHAGKAPPIEALIEAVEGHFADWEERWRHDPSLVLQPPTEQFVAEALGRLGVILPAAALADFTGAILETSAYTAKGEPPEPGMPEAMAALCGMGLRLACISNAFMPASVLDWILEERGLKPYCLQTVSSCELGYRKPHPRIYEEGLHLLDLRAGAAIFVGDRLDADIAGPAALGMGTVLTTQYREEDLRTARIQPDYIIRHLSELPGYLEKRLASD